MAAAAILLMTLIAYLPALRAGWIWDDDYYVTKNYNLRSVEGLKKIWTKFGLRNGGTPQYYPVTHTTFWLEHQLWGLRPVGYHFVNILLHATNAILLWLILKRLNVPGAWIVACAFALHPVHAESVAWVTERKNTLSGFFYLAALLTYLPLAGFANDKPFIRAAGARYGLVIILFICALLSKSVTASLPAAILLIVWWKRSRIALREVLPLVPMLVLGVAMGMLTSWMERAHVGAQGAEWELSILQRVLIAGRAVWFYAMKLVAPLDLAFIYPRWHVDPSRVWQWILPVAAVALVALFWAMRGRWGRGPIVAILFFGGTLLPALGFVDLLPMRYSFVADHFQYLASIGMIALLVSSLTTWLGDRGKPLAAIWLIALGVLTFRQALVYENLETLWSDTIAKNPTGWMPRVNLALLRIEQSRFDDAESLLRAAQEHQPEQPEVLLNLGVLAERQGRTAEAVELYQSVLSKRPDAVALTNLGRLHDVSGGAAAARDFYQRAIAANPHYAPPYTLLGVAEAQRGDFRAAAALFARAVQLDPSSAEAWNNLGVARENLGDLAGAIEAYEQAIAANPAFEKARRNLERARTRGAD